MIKARHTGFAKLSQKEVLEAITRHEALHSGRVGGARATFAFRDLSGLDLAGRVAHVIKYLQRFVAVYCWRVLCRGLILLGGQFAWRNCLGEAPLRSPI
jgi:hypothetical protein